MKPKDLVLRTARVLALLPAAWLVLPANAAAQTAVVASLSQLADLSLEQLSNIEVTSVSGRVENVQQAAASIYVITAQDIRRSTAMSLPEALRLAPNLLVAQTSAGQWAISARGFNESISNKLLVLVDGRTIYSPLFAGVFWDANDVVLEDIDRIEVISGPAGTLWGANAVNGVINVVTKSASETQGPLLSVARSTAGGREVARWGGRLGEDMHLRLSALAVDRAATARSNGATQPDASSRVQAGFRADWAAGTKSMTVQGDLYRGGDRTSANNLAPVLRGGNLLARFSDAFPDGSPWKVQLSYDLVDRDDVNLFRTRARTVDAQFTHEPKVAAGQLLWGAGYRQSRDANQATAVVRFDPGERTLAWSNVFVQHQQLLAEKLQVTAGVKLERNSYTGTETLPNVRLAWLHSPQATTWMSVSRTVRAPSRIDRDFFFPAAPPYVIAGGRNFQSETANVYEFGHRGQSGSAWSYSATVFRQDFRGLRAGTPGVSPSIVQNLVQGTIDGIEAWGQAQLTPSWRLSAGYLRLQQDLRYCCGLSPATTSFPGLGNDPRYQWTLRSSLNVGSAGEIDVLVRRVGELPAPNVPAYTAVDARWAWRVSPTLTVGVLGKNLLDRAHGEFGAAPNSQIRRRVLLQATWQL
jgi:iron complex outermembrane receptor protein